MIRRLRIAAGMTQATLADGLVSAAYISLIESGRRIPSPQLRTALLARLDADPDVGQDTRLLIKVCAATEVGDLTGARRLLDAAAHADKRPSAHRRLAHAIVDQRSGFYQRAQEEFLQLADAFTQGSEEHLRAVRGACACARYTGWLERAIAVAEQTLSHDFEKSNPTVDNLVVSIRGSAATLLALRGDYAASLAMCRVTFDQARSPWAKASALWVQAMTYEQQGNDELAVISAREALTHIRLAQRPVEEAQIANTAAWLELRLGDFDTARLAKQLDAAEEVLIAAQATDSVAALRCTRAEMHARTYGIAAARDDFEAAMAMMSPHQHVLRANNLVVMSTLFRDAGDTSSAMSMADRALVELQSTENWAETARAWHELSSAYEAVGMIEKSLVCMKNAAASIGLRSITTTDRVSAATP